MYRLLISDCMTVYVLDAVKHLKHRLHNFMLWQIFFFNLPSGTSVHRSFDATCIETEVYQQAVFEVWHFVERIWSIEPHFLFILILDVNVVSYFYPLQSIESNYHTSIRLCTGLPYRGNYDPHDIIVVDNNCLTTHRLNISRTIFWLLSAVHSGAEGQHIRIF